MLARLGHVVGPILRGMLLLTVLALSGLACPPTTGPPPAAGQGEALPQVPTHGNPTLAHPGIVTITFAGDPLAPDIEAWGDWAVASAWLTTVGADYGVDSGEHRAKVRLALPAPATAAASDIAALIQSLVTAGTLPAPAPESVYMLYYPAPSTTKLTYGSGAYCDGFSGYHDEAVVSGTKISYAVVGRCQCFWPGLTELQAVERTAAHELIEAATNPFPSTAKAFVLGEPSPGAWTVSANAWGAAGLTEIGDLCAGTQVYEDTGFVAQRIWSNSAASAGADPCIPAHQLFQSYNVRTASNWYPVAAGATVTIPMGGWSTAAMPNDWIVSASGTNAAGFSWHTVGETNATIDVSECGKSATRTFATSGNNAALSLVVTAPASATPGSYAAIRVSSITRAEAAMPDATQDDWFHYIAVGVYVPPTNLGP